MNIHLSERAVAAIIARAKRTPYFNLDGYMERDWLIKPRKWLPFSARVHKILRSDNDRHLHDHPWPYATLIMLGGYWEVTEISVGEFWALDLCGYDSDTMRIEEIGGCFYRHQWYGPGSLLFRKATDAHRLVLPAGKTATTLFMMGPYQQGWGFLTEAGKIPWRQYLGQETATEVEEKMVTHYGTKVAGSH